MSKSHLKSVGLICVTGADTNRAIELYVGKLGGLTSSIGRVCASRTPPVVACWAKHETLLSVQKAIDTQIGLDTRCVEQFNAHLACGTQLDNVVRHAVEGAYL